MAKGRTQTQTQQIIMKPIQKLDGLLCGKCRKLDKYCDCITIIDNTEVWEVKMNWYRNEQWENKIRILNEV